MNVYSGANSAYVRMATIAKNGHDAPFAPQRIHHTFQTTMKLFFTTALSLAVSVVATQSPSASQPGDPMATSSVELKLVAPEPAPPKPVTLKTLVKAPVQSPAAQAPVDPNLMCGPKNLFGLFVCPGQK